MTGIPEGMKALRDELRDVLAHPLVGSGYYSTAVAIDEATAMADALLAPDGPLWPALRALGKDAIDWVDLDTFGQGTRRERRRWLENVHGITGPLAAACLAAAEVEP